MSRRDLFIEKKTDEFIEDINDIDILKAYDTQQELGDAKRRLLQPHLSDADQFLLQGEEVMAELVRRFENFDPIIADLFTSEYDELAPAIFEYMQPLVDGKLKPIIRKGSQKRTRISPSENEDDDDDLRYYEPKKMPSPAETKRLKEESRIHLLALILSRNPHLQPPLRAFLSSSPLFKKAEPKHQTAPSEATAGSSSAGTEKNSSSATLANDEDLDVQLKRMEEKMYCVNITCADLEDEEFPQHGGVGASPPRGMGAEPPPQSTREVLNKIMPKILMHCPAALLTTVVAMFPMPDDLTAYFEVFPDIEQFVNDVTYYMCFRFDRMLRTALDFHHIRLFFHIYGGSAPMPPAGGDRLNNFRGVKDDDDDIFEGLQMPTGSPQVILQSAQPKQTLLLKKAEPKHLPPLFKKAQPKQPSKVARLLAQDLQAPVITQELKRPGNAADTMLYMNRTDLDDEDVEITDEDVLKYGNECADDNDDLEQDLGEGFDSQDSPVHASEPVLVPLFSKADSKADSKAEYSPFLHYCNGLLPLVRPMYPLQLSRGGLYHGFPLEAMILAIPYLMRAPDLLVHRVVKVYAKISEYDESIKPNCMFGYAVYFQFFTETHLRMCLCDMLQHATRQPEGPYVNLRLDNL